MSISSNAKFPWLGVPNGRRRDCVNTFRSFKGQRVVLRYFSKRWSTDGIIWPYGIDKIYVWLVVWNMFFFPYIGNNNLITPTDFNIFQRGSNHQPDVIWAHLKIKNHEQWSCLTGKRSADLDWFSQQTWVFDQQMCDLTNTTCDWTEATVIISRQELGFNQEKTGIPHLCAGEQAILWSMAIKRWIFWPIVGWWMRNECGLCRFPFWKMTFISIMWKQPWWGLGSMLGWFCLQSNTWSNMFYLDNIHQV